MIFETCRTSPTPIDLEVVTKPYAADYRVKALRVHFPGGHFDYDGFLDADARKRQMEKHGTAAMPKRLKWIIEDLIKTFRQ